MEDNWSPWCRTLETQVEECDELSGDMRGVHILLSHSQYAMRALMDALAEARGSAAAAAKLQPTPAVSFFKLTER